MTTSIIHLAVGLVLLVAVNIVLGSLNALFDGSFSWALRFPINMSFFISLYKCS